MAPAERQLRQYVTFAYDDIQNGIALEGLAYFGLLFVCSFLCAPLCVCFSNENRMKLTSSLGGWPQLFHHQILSTPGAIRSPGCC